MLAGKRDVNEENIRFSNNEEKIIKKEKKRFSLTPIHAKENRTK